MITRCGGIFSAEKAGLLAEKKKRSSGAVSFRGLGKRKEDTLETRDGLSWSGAFTMKLRRVYLIRTFRGRTMEKGYC